MLFASSRRCGPLDELRRLTLRALAGGSPLGRTLAARRSVRAPVLLSLHAFGAFALAVFAPSLLIVVGPLALGVPHLAADVRHLLVRRGWPRWWLATCAGFALALLNSASHESAHARSTPGLEGRRRRGARW